MRQQPNYDTSPRQVTLMAKFGVFVAVALIGIPTVYEVERRGIDLAGYAQDATHPAESLQQFADSSQAAVDKVGSTIDLIGKVIKYAK